MRSLLHKLEKKSLAFLEKNQLLIVVIFFVFFRLSFLEKLPVFNDESIYIDWSWRSIHWEGFAFFSLLDGKQPLVLWIVGLAQTWFSNLLWISRFTTTSFSLLTLVGLWKLTYLVTQKKSYSLTAVVFYLITPLFIFFDTQALFESASTAYTVWYYVFFTNFLRKPKAQSSLAFGLFIGLSVWIKTSLLLLLIPTLIFIATQCIKKPKERTMLIGWFAYSLVYTFFTWIPLLIQENFLESLKQNSRYTFTLTELITFPLGSWSYNLLQLLKTCIGYLTPVVLLLVFGWSKVSKKTTSASKQLVLFTLLQCGLITVVYRHLQPRYLVSGLILCMPIFAYSTQVLWEEYKFKRHVIVISSLVVLGASITIKVAPQNYLHLLHKVLGDTTYVNYYVSWNSGYAAQRAVNFIQQEIQHSPAKILVRADAGNPENMVFYSFHTTPQQQVSIFDQAVMPEIAKHSCVTSNTPIYFVARDYQLAQTERFWKEKARFYNQNNETSVGVYVPNMVCEQNALHID